MSAPERRRRRPRSPLRRRQLRCDLFDGHDRALRRNRPRGRGDRARPQTGRVRDRRRAEPPRSIFSTVVLDAPADRRLVRIRVREVVLATGAEADAGDGRPRRGRRNRDSVHSRLAADDRPRVLLMVPAAGGGDRRPRPALCVPRSACASGAKARVPSRDGGPKAGSAGASEHTRGQ